MSTHVTLADQALMEKLANLEPDPAEAEPGEQVKTASVRGQSAVAMMKAAEIVAASRRVGEARAEAEIAALLDR